MDNSYECPRCHNRLPISNKTLHDLRCTERHPMQNDSYQNNNYRNNYNRNNNNRNRNNVPFNNQQNIHTLNNPNNNMSNSNNNNNSFSFGNNFINTNNNNNNNIVSTNENSYTNPDGTTERIRIDTYQNGIQRVTRTKYDRNNNIILTQTYNQSNNNNFNNNIFNNNFNDSNNFNNNNVSVQTQTDNNGNIIEIRTEALPNGCNRVTKIIRDRNGNIIGQSVSLNNNNFNNFNAMNNMNMNNMNMNNMNMGNMNMNNMNMDMNMNMNNLGMMMNNIFGMMGMNNLGQMMNNMDDINNANNGVDPNILNNLEVTKISDVSKLNEDNKKCIICLEEFKEGDEGIYLPCFHLFHKDCIKEWLNAHDDCPICKFKLTYENINGE